MNSSRGKLVFVLAIMILVIPVLFACTTPYPLPPQIWVVYPNGGEEVPVQYPVGGMEVTWTSTSIPESEIVQVQISSDGGTTWKTVLFHDNTGGCLCPAPDIATEYGRVKISCFVEGVGVVSDTSNGDFTTNQAGAGTRSYDYYAEYYDCGLFSSTPPDDIFANPPTAPVTCMEGPVAYDWGDGAPESGAGVIQSDFFAARWRGIFHFDEGSYTFAATVDDGVRLYLDGEPIIDQWKPQVATTFEVTKSISEGDHQVKIEYFERMGVAICQVDWPSLIWRDGNGVAWRWPRRVTDDSKMDDRPSIVEFATWGLLGKYVFWHSWRSESGDSSYPNLWQKLSLDRYGASWSDPDLLTAEGDNYRPAPAIINGPETWPSKERSLWVVWSSNRAGSVGYDIYYKYLYQSSPNVWKWSSDLRLNPAGWDFSSTDQDPSIIQTQDGTIWIAWCKEVAGVSDIYLAESVDGGASWVSYPNMPELKLDYGDNEMYPTMTEKGGDIWIAFHSHKGGNDVIYYAIYRDGVFEGPYQFESSSPTLGTHPTIMQTQKGDIWIAWDRDGEIFYTLTTDGGLSWSPEVNITNSSATDQTPWLTQTSDGKVWVVWATDRDGNLEIYARCGIP